MLPQLRIADLVQRVDEDLYGAYVVAQPGPRRRPGAGDLEPLPDAAASPRCATCSTPIEWWFFGAFAAFVWWRWVRDTTAEQPAGQPPSEPVPDGEHPRTR